MTVRQKLQLGWVDGRQGAVGVVGGINFGRCSMRKLALIPLLALLATCTDDGTVTPLAPDGPEFAKGGVPGKPGGGGGGGGGEADGEYTITDLGTLFGAKARDKASSSGARDISKLDAGQQAVVVVVGASRDGTGNTAATVWTVTGTDVTIQALGEPYGFTISDARAINKSGTVVVGSAGDSEGLIPVRWTSSNSGWRATELSLMGFVTGVARDVNDAGIIVGWSQRESVEWPRNRATLWRSDAPPVELPDLPPLGESDGDRPRGNARADAINDAAGGGGELVGGASWIWIGDHYLSHAVLWKLTETTVEGPCDLHTWQPAYSDPWQDGDVLHSHAWGITGLIDGAVRVAGTRTLYRGEVRATLWTVNVDGTDWGDPGVLCTMVNENEPPQDLGSRAFALAINNDGITVGEDHSLGNVLPVLWTTDGQVVLPSLEGDYGTAQAINDAGQIVGWTRAGRRKNHAVLWTERN